MAEYYSAELGQKIRRGMDLNAEKCLCTGGGRALGFKIVDKHFYIDEDTAPIVVKIFEMYASGKSVVEICDTLNAQGYKTSTGAAFNKNSLRKMLQNKRYIGVYTYKGEETPGGMPRIVSDELFFKAQERLEKNRKAPAHTKAKQEYILTTKLFCGYCHEMMTGYGGTGKSGQVHHYYACNGVKHKTGCRKKTVRKLWIEDLVVAECRKQLTPSNIDKIAHEVVALCEREKDSTNLKRLDKLIKDNERKQRNLMTAVTECEIETVRKSLYEEMSRLSDEHNALESEYALEQASAVTLTVDEVKFFLTQLRNSRADNLEYRKTLITVFVNAIYLFDDRLTIFFNSGDTPVNIDEALLSEAIEKTGENEGSFLDSSAPPEQQKPAIHCDCWFFFVYQCFAVLSENFAVRKTSRIYDRVTNEVKRYQNSVDNRVLAFIHKWNGLKNADYKKRARVQLDTVSERAVSDLKSTVGIDATGYRHSIDGNALQHIEKRHGKNGEADHSMANENDIARISYVLDNYDEVRPVLDKNGEQKHSAVFCNADGSPAPIVLYSKRIDGTYYAAEAIPDAAAHELRVVSAYLAKNKNGNEGGMLNIPQSDPQLTPEVPPRSNVSVENNIPAAGENVNAKIRETLPEGQGAKSAEFGYDEARTQTRSTDGVLTDDERAMGGLRPEDRTHKVNHDEEVNAKAQERFESDYEGEKADLFGEKQDWDDTDTVLAHKIIVSEVAKARESGSKDAYAEVAKLMKEWDAHGTEAGQALRQRRQN